ncbi:unnamed protein product [Peniophora sp. CBMAI 1063]|nr:unnamed protein product [Peniophora sp. CBMAI 1063]
MDTNVAAPAKVKVPFWRSTWCAAIVVGLSGFLAPGVYSAMAATGAGGLANVQIGNASVAVAYALIVPSALVTTAFISKFGPRITLALGAAGYAPYAGCLYANSAYGNQWGLIVGAIVCGATSGLFWVTEGSVIMNYAEPNKKGKLIATWQSLYYSSTIIGGAINLALNYNDRSAGGLAPKTYIVFICLMCIAPFVALLLRNPEEIVRTDGKAVMDFPKESFTKEIWLTIKELGEWRVAVCSIMWTQALFLPSMVSTYVATFFNTRTRGLTSLCAPIVAIFFFLLLGHALDSKFAVRKKALIVYGTIQVGLLACIIWMLVKANSLESGEKPRYDWTDGAAFGAAWVPALLGYAFQWNSYGMNYYISGYLFKDSANGARMTRIIATLRSAESGSAAIAFGINATKFLLWKTAILNLIFAVLSVTAFTIILADVWKRDLKGEFDVWHGGAKGDATGTESKADTASSHDEKVAEP